MDKTKCKVALFDVDGTIVNGNCTQIFIQFLLETSTITEKEIAPYKLLLKNYTSLHNSSLEIANVAFYILSRINKEELTKLWKNCFKERVVKKFNTSVINIIQDFQSNETKIFLASGSPAELVKEVAAYFNIPEENIIASKIEKRNGQQISNSNQYCIGPEKERAFRHLLHDQKLDLDQTCFFSDNISDLQLLSLVGWGFWVGNSDEYDNYSMSTLGIEEFYAASNLQSIEIEKENLLADYLIEKKSIIKDSMSLIFPLQGNTQSIDKIIGASYDNWDLITMQKAYFDPVNEYLEKYNDRLVALGTCIFLEAGGIKLSDNLQLLGIGELLYISNKVFVDITRWTSGESKYKSGKSHVEISVLGNASISLLSLPLYNIINNNHALDSETKMKLYEMYTSIVHNSLFGNGVRFYWEQQNENNIRLEEYFDVASLKNRGFLQFATDLALILSTNNIDKSFRNVISAMTMNAAQLIQLLKDRLAFRNLQSNFKSEWQNNFHLSSNILSIHACQVTKKPTLFTGRKSNDELNDIFESTGSIKFLDKTIQTFREKVNQNIDSLPYQERYKILINLYINQLVYL